MRKSERESVIGVAMELVNEVNVSPERNDLRRLIKEKGIPDDLVSPVFHTFRDNFSLRHPSPGNQNQR